MSEVYFHQQLISSLSSSMHKTVKTANIVQCQLYCVTVFIWLWWFIQAEEEDNCSSSSPPTTWFYEFRSCESWWYPPDQWQVRRVSSFLLTTFLSSSWTQELWQHNRDHLHSHQSQHHQQYYYASAQLLSSTLNAMILPGYQTSDSASTSKFHHMALLVVLVSHASNFHY